MPNIHINVGSNQNREESIATAIDMLQFNFSQIQLSDIYESPAQGFEGDDFFNFGVNATTDLNIEDTKKVLKNIEDKIGRDRNQPKFSARIIDLDLVLYDSVVDAKENLPRDDILKYAFVLAPLAQLNSTAVHPLKNCTYQSLWQTFQTDNSFELSQYNINQILK